MTHNDVVVVDLDDHDRRISDEVVAQSVHDDVVEDERLVPRRTQRLVNDLHEGHFSEFSTQILPAYVARLKQFSFFIARQHTDARYIDIANLSVRLSVRPSVCPSVRYVPVSDENGLTYRHSFFSPYGSPIILVLPASKIFTKFRRGHPLRGAKYRWGIRNSRFSTNKSL